MRRQRCASRRWIRWNLERREREACSSAIARRCARVRLLRPEVVRPRQAQAGDRQASLVLAGQRLLPYVPRSAFPAADFHVHPRRPCYRAAPIDRSGCAAAASLAGAAGGSDCAAPASALGSQFPVVVARSRASVAPARPSTTSRPLTPAAIGASHHFHKDRVPEVPRVPRCLACPGCLRFSPSCRPWPGSARRSRRALRPPPSPPDRDRRPPTRQAFPRRDTRRPAACRRREAHA